MGRNRIILAFGYVLATLLAQGVHDHGVESARSQQPAHPSAAGQGPHFCSAIVPAQDGANTCAACQFRGQHQASPLAMLNPGRIVTSLDCDEMLRLWWPAPILRHVCRAPPCSA